MRAVVVVPAEVFAELRGSRDPLAIVVLGHGSPFTDRVVAATADYDVVAPKSVEPVGGLAEGRQTPPLVASSS